MNRSTLAAMLLLGSGCAHVLAVAPPPLTVAPGALSVRAEPPCRASDLAEVARAAREALPALVRWGALSAPVSVVVVPSHEALEAAAHHAGFPWLRAWARYDVVYLQAPHTWGLFEGTPAQLRDVLMHELTHCAMFQASAGPDDWVGRHIPFWFREGLASWAAGQGGRRWSRRELGRTLARAPALDPLEDGDALSQSDPGLAYSAAHWAVADLAARSGEVALRRLLSTMKAGAAFDVAFHSVYGESVWRFEHGFLEALRRGVP